MCDVIPMNVTHILLGRPWLFDQQAHTANKKNTHSFLWKDNRSISFHCNRQHLIYLHHRLQPKSKQKEDFMTTSGETTYRTSKMDHTSKELDDMGTNFFLWTVLIKGHKRQRKKRETRH